MTENEKIKAFLATRGATRVEEGARSLSNNRGDWRARVRGELTSAEKHENALIAQHRMIATDHCGREFWVNGLGEPIQ